MRLFDFNAQLANCFFTKFNLPSNEAKYIESAKSNSKYMVYLSRLPTAALFIMVFVDVIAKKGTFLLCFLTCVLIACLTILRYSMSFKAFDTEKVQLARVFIECCIIVEHYCPKRPFNLCQLANNNIMALMCLLLWDFKYWITLPAIKRTDVIMNADVLVYVIIRKEIHSLYYFSWSIFALMLFKIAIFTFFYQIDKLKRQNYMLKEELNSNNMSWNSLFEDTNNPIIILNKSGVMLMNKVFIKTFSITKIHMKEDSDFMLEQLSDGEQSLLSYVDSFLAPNKINNDGVHKSLGLFTLQNENSSCSFEVSIKPVYWKGSYSAYLSLKDITDTIINQKELLSKEYRNILLTTAAHELKNPLNGIMGGIQLISDGHLTCSSPINPMILETVKANVDLLENFINCLTDYCQCEVGKFEVVNKEFDLNDIINHCVSLLRLQAEQRNVQIKVNLAPNCPKCIVSDENRIKQIIINLLSNAVKYTYKGFITIRTTYRDPIIEIMIADTGIGIKDSVKSSLFKFFGRIGQKAEGIDAGAGAGLGLTISQALATKIGYGIVFESNNKGSKFKFSIVLNQKESPHAGTPSSKKTNQLGRAKIPFYSKNSVDFAIASYHNEDKHLEKKKGDIKKESNESITSPIAFNKSTSVCYELKRVSNSVINKCVNKIDENIIEEVESSSEEAEAMCEFTSRHETQMSIRDTCVSSYNPFCIHAQTSYSSCNCKPLIIVDDNPFNLMVLEGFLTKLGLSAEKAYNGKDAIEIIERISKCKCNKLKAILTDCEMPVMNGFDEAVILSTKMTTGEYVRVPIIAVTAYCDEATKLKCLESGMDCFLGKPVKLCDLKSTLIGYNVM